MRPRPPARAPSSNATPIVIVIVSVALIGGLAWYFLTQQEPVLVKSAAEKAAESTTLPTIEADPEMKTGTRRVRTSEWDFEESGTGKKLVGKIAFESDDKEEVLRGDTTLSDVRYKLFSASGEKLKVGYLPFHDLKSGQSSPTEMTYGAWKRVKRVWIEKTLREATQEK